MTVNIKGFQEWNSACTADCDNYGSCPYKGQPVDRQPGEMFCAAGQAEDRKYADSLKNE